MKNKIPALIAAFLAALIYAINFTVAKDVMPMYVKPFGFILLRVGGATILFWILSFFAKKEKIEKRDFLTIISAAFFGVALNMLSFFKGLSMTTPISASVIMVTTPILVLILSAFILKEKITAIKILGILIGLSGAVLLIAYGQSLNTGENAMLGNFLVFVNAASYAMYLIVVKKLTQKYHPFTFVKWLYFFGLIMIIPFSFSEALEIQWATINTSIMLKIIFVVVFSTFCTYLFNIFALTKLKPTTLSSFIYLQPLLATLYALLVGSDTINTTKILAAMLIFLGVFLVTKSNANPSKENT